MTTHAVIYRRVSEQIVVQAVRVDGETKTPISSEQIIVIANHPFKPETVEWGPAMNNVLEDLGAKGDDIKKLKAITAKDLSLLSLLLSPRAVTKAAKAVIVSTLEGRAHDIARVLIGEDQAPMQDVLNAVEDLKEWAAAQGKKDE